MYSSVCTDCIDEDHTLRRSPNVFLEYDARFCHSIADVHHDDISMNVEEACEAGRSDIYKCVKRLSLREVRAFACKGVTESVAHNAFPLCLRDDNDDFSSLSADVCTNLAESVLVTMSLKELGIPLVVCKAHDDVHAQVLKKLGADRVVIPEKENAQRLAKSLSSENVLDYIELSDDYGIIDVPAPKSWLHKNLRELNVRAKLGVNILAVKRGGKINVSPSADFAIEAEDVMVILGDNQALSRVQKL